MIVIEGNGSRPSHYGNGYKDSEEMFTLNTTEVHGVAYGFEPGILSRDGAVNRFIPEQSPTIRANMGDNQTAVCYGVCSYDSNSMKSSNPFSEFYEAKTARTLDNNGGNPACNQGGGNYIADRVRKAA